MATFTAYDISRLMSSLKRGQANAIHAADLASILGFSPLPNQEELRVLIRQAIDQGELILSSHSGYYIPASLQEVEELLDSLERRAQGVCDRRNNILNSWNNHNPENTSSMPIVTVKP